MNQLLAANAHRALLALEDGSTFEGLSAGADGEAFGEIVFNTSLTGYQEVVSDPSYAGQIVTFTYPQIGNYGVCEQDMQLDTLSLAGVVVHDMCHTPSNWRSTKSFPDLLREHGVVAIEGINTRALTLRVRDVGTMRAAISTTDLDPAHLVARVQASPSIGEHNWVADVSCVEPFELVAPTEMSAFAACDVERAHYRVVAVDCGEKRGILQGLVAAGLNVTSVHWSTSAQDILAYQPDGVFFSNGPGDPRSLPELAHTVRDLLGRVPLFGICLGHQMLSMASGATIEKLPYGHHGGNQPVMNLLSGMVEITAQNHNYGLDFTSLGPLVPELCAGEHQHREDLRYWCERHIAPVVMSEKVGRVRLTHVNLNDGTPEGIQLLDCNAFSVQYHPEACPGPHDALYLFEAFRRLIEGDEHYLAIDVREGRRF